MQTACHRCGAVLEEGTAFCPACGAPQIRVNPADAPGTPAFPPGTPGNIQPPALPVATRIDWGPGLKAALLMGLVAAVPSSIPFVSLFCCVWIIGAAALSVMLYQKWRPGLVTTGLGARLGAVTGLFTFAFWFLFAAIVQVARGTGQFREQLMQGMREGAARNPDPNAQVMIERMSTPEGIAILITLIVVCVFLAFVIFGVIGGALGASIWGKRQQA
jgi:hypothetical protein